MAQKKITELTELTAPASTFYFPVEEENAEETKRISLGSLIDSTLTTSGKAADAKATGDAIAEKADAQEVEAEIADLKSDLTIVAEGAVPIEKDITWKNGYVATSGTIFASTASQFSLVELNKGETVTVGTRNKNITIIGSTTAESVDVGDSVTPLIKTPSENKYVEFTYTAVSKINIVVCVLRSEYYLGFKAESDFSKEIAVNYLEEYTKFSFDISGQRVRPTNGTWTYHNGYYRTDFIPCEAGERIIYYGRSAWNQGESLTALLAFYDIDKDFISSIYQFGSETTNTTGTLDVTAPENAHYFRSCTYGLSDGFGITLYDVKNLIDETIAKVSQIAIDDKDIITAVIGSDLPDDAVTRFNVTKAYAEKMKEVITAWMSDYAGDYNKTPFILHTDQHGRLAEAKKGIFDMINYLVNWDGVSAIFNLGDTVVDHWTDDDTSTNPLLRNATLEDARKCLSGIPNHKKINVYGNHDTWYQGDVETLVSGTLPSMQYNNPYFTTKGLRTITSGDNSGLMCVYDDQTKIKYLVLAGWDYADKAAEKPGDLTGYQWYWINQKHLDWIVKQLSANDGYDIVIVSHVALCLTNGAAVNPITGINLNLQTPEYIVHYDSYLNALWNARKNKTSGSVSTGNISASYDFTQCETNLLCAIAGHTHTDAVQYVADANDGVLQAVFDWFADDTIHFGIIDKAQRLLKVWKISNTSNTPAIDTWQMPFDKA